MSLLRMSGNDILQRREKRRGLGLAFAYRTLFELVIMLVVRTKVFKTIYICKEKNSRKVVVEDSEGTVT